MCGIIGYVGPREAKPLLLDGLKRLEYRGYDSAGIALREDGELDVRPRGRQPRQPRRGGRHERLARAPRPRPHALGDARRRHRAQRAPAHGLRRRPPRDRPQRDRRELHGAARRPHRSAATRSPPRPTPKSSSTCSSRSTTATSRRRSRASTRSSRATSRSSRSTTTIPTCSSASATRRRSSSGSATGRTSSPRRSPPSSARRAPSSIRADGQVIEITPTSVRFFVDGAEIETPERAGDRLGRGKRREGRLRDVHAEGDLRAAGGGGARRSATASAATSSCSRRSA